MAADAEVDLSRPDDELAPSGEPVVGTRRAVAGPGRELGFDRPGGPLVVICGLHCGAGASTLAHSFGHYSARASAPVLLCEAPAASGDQRALSGLQYTFSLAEPTVTLAQGDRPPVGVVAQRDGLRVLATHPQGPSDPSFAGDPPRVLRAASIEHGPTVLDGATIRDAATRELLCAATHVIWALSARPMAARARARRLRQPADPRARRGADRAVRATPDATRSRRSSATCVVARYG